MSPRIALVSEEYPPYHQGGTGTFCYNLANLLSKEKIAVTVFCGKSAKVQRNKINDYLDIVRIPALDFPPRYFWFQLQNLSNISKCMKNYDVIHSISPEVSPICVYLKNQLKKPLITSYHGTTRQELVAFINSPTSFWSTYDVGFHVLEQPLYDLCNRISIKASDHIITCSKTVLAELKSSYKNLDPKKASVIYNGIDLNEIQQIRENYKQLDKTKEIVLIHYGRLIWAKGTVYTIKAFALLLPKYPNLKLKIYGKGPLQKKMQSLVTLLGLNSQIQILGQIPRNRLLEEIIAADVAVLPSLREAQPISVLEAMAIGKPVVVFNLPFAREYINDSVDGMLAEPSNIKDLAEKIDMVLSNTQLRNMLSTNARKQILQNHNWDSLIEKYIDLYNQLASAL